MLSEQYRLLQRQGRQRGGRLEQEEEVLGAHGHDESGGARGPDGRRPEASTPQSQPQGGASPLVPPPLSRAQMGAGHPVPIHNVVFMGMGEPLHNYDAVMAALDILSDHGGLMFSRAKVIVSSVGLVPQVGF